MQTKIAKKTSVNTQLKHSSMKTFMSVSTMYDSRKTAKFLAERNNFLVIVRDLFITMTHYTTISASYVTPTMLASETNQCQKNAFI
ncbi:hypothetical protein C9J47_25875 [Photobacterium indicum]|jgi:hypothetical protein|uniref:Uncharacterized protein n=1 Tax=Photobacterium indicum TaxID=81447 RepID=A0A2T3L1D3_9GAMM|nr:hypothetical protein C9J47_25875 [Photobacterium indicum]